ncbi:MAG: alkaline phosphatase family protein [Nanoarchaeota archaeon]|nr:alkaline phosphatase family protein [Nanoarchaeota archaeon]
MRILFLTITFILAIYLINNNLTDNTVKMGETNYKKILLIGIDGMDPKITDQLIKQGKLPNFQKLKEQRTYTTLGTSLPPHSPVAWTTIATGTNPGKHNIFDFIRMNFERQLPELSLSKELGGIGGTTYQSYIKEEPFWKITSRADIPSTIIRWPVSFPAEEVNGNLLAGLGVPDIKGFLSDYTIYTTEPNKFKEQKKTIELENLGETIKTTISGPRIKKGGEIVPVTVPLSIDFDEKEKKVILTVQDNKYPLKEGEWSDWIQLKFKASMFKNVQGICRAYLISIGPEFTMYLTDVQIHPENPVVDISYPKEYSNELAKEIGLYYTLGMPEDTGALTDEAISDEIFLEQTKHIEDERNKMFWLEFEKFKKSEKGILAFVYDTSDRIQHVFWEHKLLTKETPKDIKLNDAVINYFEEKDDFLGKIIEQIDENTALIVLSDHGFTSFEKNVDINSWLSKNGFMALTGQPTEKNNGELFQLVDWSKTKAYSVGFNGIYINIDGRETKGVVEETEREKVVAEIIEKLQELKDPETGKNIIYKLYKKEDVYQGDNLKYAPDIIIGFYPGYRMSWQTAIGGLTQEVIFDNNKKWSGDHLVDPSFVPGVLFTNFKINKENPHQIDVAPTILNLAGIKTPENMDGESLVQK